MSLKRMMLERGMKLMSDPRVMKVVSNPKFMNLVMKGFQLRGRAQAHVDEQLRRVARTFKLATHDEVAELQRTIRDLENALHDMQSQHSP
jgi:hypothetical protein